MTSNSFVSDVNSFINNHKKLCIFTAGLAILGYSIGNLAGRAVRWVSKTCGTSKKADAIGRETLKNTTTSSSNKLDAPLALDTSCISNMLLNAYHKPEEGWVMVPPKDLIEIDAPFVVGSGAIGYEGNGSWKIHLSIDPEQMEQAIPIIADVLFAPDAPRLGFKMQTKSNLDSVHQIGKEFAIIFDKDVEKSGGKSIKKCLRSLWNRLYDAGIRPERGYVLTPETMEQIANAEEGQVKEQDNLKAGKFDRAIPCPKGCNFFHYRDENYVPMQDEEFTKLIGDLADDAEGLERQGLFSASRIAGWARSKETAHLAHNPTKKPDPFLNLDLT